MKATTQRDATGGDAIRHSGTAAVVRLPGADGPAIQQRPPRGRRPKHVLSLWRARLDRSQALTVLALQAQLALLVQMDEESYRRGEVLWTNMNESKRLHDLNLAEGRVLNQQLLTIKAQLAQAAKVGAA